MPKLTLFILSCIFIFGLGLRYINLSGNNLVFDYDQIEDQFYTYTVAVDKNPAIIGRAVYGDPRLHHGVFYYYYNALPFLISKGNLFVSAYWNSFFNVFTGIILFILARLLFNKNLPGFIAAFVVAFSFEFIKFSNWLTIDTPAIFLIPLFCLSLWGVYLKKFWAYLLLPIILGLCIQTDLSLMYLIPTTLIFWIIFRPKLPALKISLLSFFLFFLTIGTLIVTEIKLQFAGVLFLLNFSENFSRAAELNLFKRTYLFFEDFGRNFSSNLLPHKPDLGLYLAILIISSAVYYLYHEKIKLDERKGIIFLLFYLLSPAVTLILGYHDTPWFLIGLPGGVALISGYVISKLKLVLIIPILLIIAVSNFYIIKTRPNEAYKLFDFYYDPTSYLAYQLEVVDYTYQNSNGKPFAINAVTYPLYYNGLWAYLYNFYGKERFGYTPSWLGGDQVYPYGLLPKSEGKEKTFYMLISGTKRIPEWEKDTGKSWALNRGKLIEEKKIKGFEVLKLERADEKPKPL